MAATITITARSWAPTSRCSSARICAAASARCRSSCSSSRCFIRRWGPRDGPRYPQAFGPSGLIANRAGELEILAREAAGVVGGEDERHGVVADVDVGMVAGGLGEAAHPVDERQRLPEIAEPIRPAQLAAGALPARRAPERGADGRLVQPAHSRTNFWRARIPRGGVSLLPCGVHAPPAPEKSPCEAAAAPWGGTTAAGPARAEGPPARAI